MTTIAVFGSSATEPSTPEWEAGVRLGGALAERGWIVTTGGYGGSMEAVSEGAAVAGGTVIGVTAPAVFPERSGVNRHVTEERPATSIGTRIASIVDGSDASVALPGSLGTFAELVVAWNDAYVAPMSGQHPRPVVAVGRAWETALEALADVFESGHGLVTVVDDVDAAVAILDERLAMQRR